MDNGDTRDGEFRSLTAHYAQRLAEGVELPSWAAASFSSAELAVLGVIRDAAYKTIDSTCSLSMEEIARLIDVHPRTVARAITVAIAAGVLERDGATIINRGVSYKIG